MKLLRFTTFLFYRYYGRGRNADRDPYFRAISSMTLLVFLHLFQGLILFQAIDLIPIGPTDSRTEKRFVTLLLMLPIYLILSRLVRKKQMQSLEEQYDYDWDRVFRGNVWLVIYILASVALTTILPFFVRKTS